MTLEISESGKAFIKARESCRLSPYRDIVGIWTVGWGHVLKPGEQRASLSQDEADALFDTDILYYIDAVNDAVTVELNTWQFDCCCSLAYNIGTTAFKKSTFVQYLNDERPAEACIELLTWRKAGGKNVDGLLNRRAHEVLVFARGEYT